MSNPLYADVIFIPTLVDILQNYETVEIFTNLYLDLCTGVKDRATQYLRPYLDSDKPENDTAYDAKFEDVGGKLQAVKFQSIDAWITEFNAKETIELKQAFITETISYLLSLQ